MKFTGDFKHFKNEDGEDENNLYWRLYYVKDEKYVTVVEMQPLDEFGYNREDFVKSKDTHENYYFTTESSAIKYLNQWFDQDEIDPAYYKSINLER